MPNIVLSTETITIKKKAYDFMDLTFWLEGDRHRSNEEKNSRW